MLDKLLQINKRLCQAITPYLPQAKSNIFDSYDELVGRCMNSKPDQVVVDVGAGRTCPFAKFRNPSQRTKIIGVDTSSQQMQDNYDLNEKKVADVTRNLPFADRSVDLVVSRSVLEHLPDVEGFTALAKRVLRKGGMFIHLFPSAYAPFALIRRVLPDPLARKLLFTLHPQFEEICGFPAHYDQCTPSRFQRVLRRHDFEVVEMHVSYFQSPYFNFFFPFFLASAIYEMGVKAMGLVDFCAYALVAARKIT